MAKITIPDITSGFASVTQLNDAFDDIEAEFQNKVLYRDNTSGEANQMENDLDMNNNDILNVRTLILQGGVDIADQASQAAASAAAAEASNIAAGVSASSASASASAASTSASNAATSESNAAASAASLDGWEYRGSWLTATAYVEDNIVTEAGTSYICILAHTSGVFATDFAANKWAIFAAQGSGGAGTGDVVAANNLSDLANVATARANLGISATNTPFTPAGNLAATDVQAALQELDSEKISTVPDGDKGDITVSATGATWTIDNGVVSFAKLGADVITGATAETAPAVGDLLMLHDISETANNKITLENLLKVINGLTADASPDTAADYLVTYDASAGAAKKVLLSTIQAANQGVAKAWVTFNGTGTAAIVTDFNVTSLTDNGTGNYTINLTNTQTDANYVALASDMTKDGNAIVDTKTTTSYRIRTYNDSGTITDYDGITSVIFGN